MSGLTSTYCRFCGSELFTQNNEDDYSSQEIMCEDCIEDWLDQSGEIDE